MTGLKSGSGDDLWGDDGEDETESDDANGSSAESVSTEQPTDSESDGEPDDRDESSNEDEAQAAGASDTSDARAAEDATESAATAETESSDAIETTDATATTEATDAGQDGTTPAIDPAAIDGGSTGDSQSYIVRRAVQDKSVQFERDERLTFFVHDDVAEGERDLVTELQNALGRDVPKFDVREAVYRAALRNPNDVLEELLEMGYSVDEE